MIPINRSAATTTTSSTENDLAEAAKLKGRHVQRQRSFTMEGGKAAELVKDTPSKVATAASAPFVSVADDFSSIEELKNAVIKDYMMCADLFEEITNPHAIRKLDIIHSTMKTHQETTEIYRKSHSVEGNEKLKTLFAVIDQHISMFFISYDAISSSNEKEKAEEVADKEEAATAELDTKHAAELEANKIDMSAEITAIKDKLKENVKNYSGFILSEEISQKDYTESQNIKKLFDSNKNEFTTLKQRCKGLNLNTKDKNGINACQEYIDAFEDFYTYNNGSIFEKFKSSRKSQHEKETNSKNLRLMEEFESKIKNEQSSKALKSKYEGLQTWVMTKVVELKHTHEQEDLEYLLKEVAAKQNEITSKDRSIIRKAYPDIQGDNYDPANPNTFEVSDEYDKAVAVSTLFDELKRDIFAKMTSGNIVSKVSEEQRTNALKKKYDNLLDWIITKKVEAQFTDQVNDLQNIFSQIKKRQNELCKMDEYIIREAYSTRPDFEPAELRTVECVDQSFAKLKLFIRAKILSLD